LIITSFVFVLSTVNIWLILLMRVEIHDPTVFARPTARGVPGEDADADAGPLSRILSLSMWVFGPESGFGLGCEGELKLGEGECAMLKPAPRPARLPGMGVCASRSMYASC